MAKTKKSPTSNTKSSKTKAVAVRPRVRKSPSYKTFRLSPRIKNTRPPLPKARKIFVGSLGVMRKNRRAVSGILLIYGFFYLLMVRSLTGGINLSALKDLVGETSGGLVNQGEIALGLFSYLVSGEGSPSDQLTSTYQSILTLLMSLALIWVFRQARKGKTVRVRDAFYKGMYPLIPFMLVLIVIILQLVPAMAGNTVYQTVVNNGLAVTVVERVLWAVLFGLSVILSVYMFSSSVFALYIVTLPDMTPMQALRSARKLVLHRRWQVIRKLIALPAFLLIVMAAVIVPLIILAPNLAEWAFLVLSIAALSVVHSYMYALYRELL